MSRKRSYSEGDGEVFEDVSMALPDSTDHENFTPFFSNSKQPRIYMTRRSGLPQRLIIEFLPTGVELLEGSHSNTLATGRGETIPTPTNKREVTVLKRHDSLLFGVASMSELDSELTKYAARKLSIDQMPSVDTLAAPKLCSTRLQYLSSLLENDNIVDKQDIISNLKYSIAVLDTLYIEETKRLFDEDDVLNEVQPDAVPSEVREWLAQTFTRSQSVSRVRGERPKFKSVAQAVRAGLMVERIYRRMSSFSESYIQMTAPVASMLKRIDQWHFNVFDLDEKTDGHSLRFVGHELLRNQHLLTKLRMNSANLDNFLLALESGYGKYGNPYHNLIHGADVAQTTYTLLHGSGLLKWLSDIEIFATIIAALIHDYEHTGTTNNFHIMSSTPLALLYNDKAVLENHHVCAAFELMRSDDRNILIGLKAEEYREFRALVIDMVLATDMSIHFQQIKNMKSMLSCAENIEKSKALCLILHTADISHPSKPWDMHKRWTDQLIEEFFKQGDREKELGLPCSPLCDRQTTLVEKSQIGFIDFIVNPSFNVLGDMMATITDVLQNGSKSDTYNNRVSENPSSTCKDVDINRPWEEHIFANRKRWKQLAGMEDDEDKEQNDSNNNTNTSCEQTHQVVSRSTSTTSLPVEKIIRSSYQRQASGSADNLHVLSKQTSTTGISIVTESKILYPSKRPFSNKKK